MPKVSKFKSETKITEFNCERIKIQIASGAEFEIVEIAEGITVRKLHEGEGIKVRPIVSNKILIE